MSDERAQPVPILKTSPEYPSCASAFWDPRSVGPDQGAGGFKELSHDDDNGDLWRFSGGVKRFATWDAFDDETLSAIDRVDGRRLAAS